MAEVNVAFTAPVNDGGSPIISYTVTSTPGGITATGNASPISVTGLADATEYTFTVVATNAVGNSIPSAPSAPLTTLGAAPTVPDAPTDVTATNPA